MTSPEFTEASDIERSTRIIEAAAVAYNRPLGETVGAVLADCAPTLPVERALGYFSVLVGSVMLAKAAEIDDTETRLLHADVASLALCCLVHGDDIFSLTESR